MIDLHLARRLRDAGLIWKPVEADRFIIPDRDLDDQIFTISTMTVEAKQLPSGPVIAFNGVVEWALDAIERREVVWLPREDQLRERLGSALLALERVDDSTWHCVLVSDVVFVAEQPVTAYGDAVLHLLERANEELLKSV